MIYKDCRYCGATIFKGQSSCRPCFEILEVFRKVRAKAIRAVNTEVAAGRMQRAADFKCVDCGKQAKIYEHRDYDYPLAVVPTCHPCNIRRGSAKQHPFKGPRPKFAWNGPFEAAK